MKLLCTTHFIPTSLKTLRRIHRTNEEQLSAISSSTEDGQFLIRTRLQIRNQMLSNAIQQREDEHVQRQIQYLSRHPKQHPSASLARTHKLDDLLLLPPPPPTSSSSTSRSGRIQLPSPSSSVTPTQTNTNKNNQSTHDISSSSINTRGTTSTMNSSSSKSILRIPSTNLSFTKPSTMPSVSSKPISKDVSKETAPLSLFVPPPPPPPPPPSSSSSSSEQCPICGLQFANDMNLVRRTKHVERCLSRSSSPSSSRQTTLSRSNRSIQSSISSSRKSSTPNHAIEIDLTNSDGDDLWDNEKDDDDNNSDEEDDIITQSSTHSHSSHSPHSSITRTNSSSKTSRRDVKASRGKRVLIDDGEDRFYFSLLYKYLRWRAASRSLDQCTREKVEQYHNEYIEQASVLNEWSNPSSPPSKEHLTTVLNDYYLHEPAYLLQSGYIIPSHLYDSLYTYQKQGVTWMLGLHRQNLGGILADEMGLGKTLQVVATLIALQFSRGAYTVGRDFSLCPRGDYEVEEGKDKETANTATTTTTTTTDDDDDDDNHSKQPPIQLETDESAERDNDHKVADFNPASIPNLPSLFVVPATLLGHWMRELRCWCPLLRSVVVHSTSETMSEGATLRGILQQCNVSHRYQVILTTYEGMRSSSLYRKQDWLYAILDEGGKIKNSKVTVSQRSRLIRTQHRLLISGTPLQNNLKELWSLVDFVYPGKLGTQEAFVSTYVIPISRGIYSNASLKQSQLGYQMSLMLQDTINPYILRRLKKVCDDCDSSNTSEEYYCIQIEYFE